MSESMILGGPEGQEDFTIIGDEDELDAFNDETFGSADQWQESEHENLAKLTEQERSALQASNDFFDFGSGDDEGESLEPEPNQNGGSDDGAGGDLPQLSKLNLEQGVQAPLTIQTQTGLPVNPMVYPQVVPVPYHLPQQQVPFNLVPPAHFQAQVQSGPGESLQDPAIMSVIKVPQGPMVINPQHYQQVQMHRGTFPGGLPPAPVQNFPQNANTFPGGTIIQDPNSEFRRAPPTVLGYKTMQDVENEMLYGNRNHQHQHQQQQQQQMQQHQLPMNQAFQQQQQHGFNQSRQHQHQMNQHQQVPLQRNLNYPGMRDRQQQQVYNNINQQRRDEHHHHQQQQQQHHNQQQQRNNHHQDNARNNQNWNNHQEPRHNRNHHRGIQHHEEDYHRHQKEDDENNWRWNEVRRNRDSATRKDLMPGHVHTLGILRHSRSRHEPNLDDDCLGDAEPLINPTGDPRLDAKLMQEQAELASRCRYFDETEDEYAGLMTPRDKQFIINIQLSQLKCENPYVDDYYYTMYTAKKQHMEDPESTGQMLLSESIDQDQEYIPTQFSNSLGKLQVVTVKAPRQIIDVGVVRCQESPVTVPTTDPGVTIVKDIKRSSDYKTTLLQLERVYGTLLDLESFKLKLAAIPTGAPLREQVTLDLTRLIQNLVTSLSKPGLVAQYLQIRKGRGLLCRCLKHLPAAAAARLSQELVEHLYLVCRESSWDERIWVHLHRYLAQSSMSSLEASIASLARGKDSHLATVLASPLGLSTILAVLYRAVSAAKRGTEKISVPVWREFILKVLSTCPTSSLPKPLVPPQPLDIGFLLTLPSDKMQAWDAFMAGVGIDVNKEKS